MERFMEEMAPVGAPQARHRPLHQGLGAVLLSALAAGFAAHAEDAIVRFSVRAQPLAPGLLQLGQQAHISIAVPQDLAEGKTGAAVEGNMDVRSALAKILAPSGLSFEFVAPDAVRIRRAPPAPIPPIRAPPPPAPAAQEAVMLEEVMVTARRRPEFLADVPISVQVVDGAAAAAKNLDDLQDITSLLPTAGFRPNTSQRDRVVFIRGVGTISSSQSPEPSVATVIDGVVMARSGQAAINLGDVNRIEVLNGPQGTLFGKNASAGVVHILTNNPTSTPSGYVDAGWYQGNEYRVDGALSGPIVEGVNGRLALFTSGYDGNVENLYYHDKANGYQYEGGRAKLSASPTAGLTLTFAADFDRSMENVPAGVFSATSQTPYCPSFLIHPPAPNPCTPNVSTPNPALAALLASEGIRASPDNRTISNNGVNNAYDDNSGVSLQANWDLGGGYSLLSISAWRLWRNTVPSYDDDQISTFGPGVPQLEDAGYVDDTQVSQELRIVSPTGHFLDYVGGLYFMRSVDHEDYERVVTRYVSAQDPAQVDEGASRFGSSDLNAALYGETDLNFTERLRALIGYRQIFDHVTYYMNRVTTGTTALPGVEPSFADEGGMSRTGWAGRTGLQYDVNPDVMAYTTVSRGYKGPAYNVFFNMALINTPPLNPETSNDYEIGLKSQLLDRRVQLDIAGFLTDFHNYQANIAQSVAGTLVSNLINAGSVTTRGVEASVAARPIPGLTYSLNGIYDRAYVQHFPCAAGSPATCYIDGQPLPFAPRWKLHAEQDYRHPVSRLLDVDVDTEYRWQSWVQYQLNQSPDTIQPAYGIWDASLGLIDSRDGWSARLLLKNILDQHYSSFLQDGNLAGVTRWVPRDDNRYFGINVRKDF
jgi:iron complex outermembrane recepter protein